MPSLTLAIDDDGHGARGTRVRVLDEDGVVLGELSGVASVALKVEASTPFARAVIEVANPSYVLTSGQGGIRG